MTMMTNSRTDGADSLNLFQSCTFEVTFLGGMAQEAREKEACEKSNIGAIDTIAHRRFRRYVSVCG